MSNTQMINSKISIDDFKLIESKLNIIFNQLKNKKIFITGGTGFFGKWLLEAINYLNFNNDLNLDVTVLSRNPDKFKINYPYINNGIKFIKGDVKTISYFNIDFDYIIHAATEVSDSREYESLYQDVFLGTKNICKFSNQANCKRFIYISSGAAYGCLENQDDFFIESEKYNTEFLDEYAQVKLDSEKYLKLNMNAILTIARCFSFAGPYLPLYGSYAFGNFIKNKMKNERININSTGDSIRSYLYAADMVIWLFIILINGEDKEIYNVGSDNFLTIKELAISISDENSIDL
ncbi:NAD-dependent epimerase/dehydratase family protein, partial [Photobacterium damselae]|uniref:NAD-dependent epimerase/dehydratase family protein n=1 Tax=Photobacterium damselae TaxID=38293 RepID=UPI001EFEDAF4